MRTPNKPLDPTPHNAAQLSAGQRHDVSAAGCIRWVGPPAHMGLYFG